MNKKILYKIAALFCFFFPNIFPIYVFFEGFGTISTGISGVIAKMGLVRLKKELSVLLLFPNKLTLLIPFKKPNVHQWLSKEKIQCHCLICRSNYVIVQIYD